MIFLRKITAHLQKQSRFTDTGISPHQCQGTLYNAAAQHTIQFTDTGQKFIFVSYSTLRENIDLSPVGLAVEACACVLDVLRANRLLYKSIPLPAPRALSHPFGGLIAAILTIKHGCSLCLCHNTPHFTYLDCNTKKPTLSFTLITTKPQPPKLPH